MEGLHPETGLQLAVTLMAVMCADLGVSSDRIISVLRTNGAAQAASGNTELAASIRKFADFLDASGGLGPPA